MWGTSSMDTFFNPQGIALIGATPNPLKGGNAILKNLMKGFKDHIYPVNPGYDKILGLDCYPSLDQVPDPVDLAIVFIPGKFVPGVIEACAKRGIQRVIIQSSGFAESGADGVKMQQDLAEFARKAGVRLWGPNCMGYVDAVNQKVLSFVSPELWDFLMPGDVSLIVQSGMLSGAFLIDCMSHGTMGISKVCSIGNKMDVDECEILEYLITDPHTRVIGLYLESINQGRRFMEICRHSTKPIVLLKGGKSAMGAKAAMGHTASMAGNGAVIRGAMAQAGVMEATDFNQMMDLCRALAAYPEVNCQGKGKKGRVAVLTYTGGAGIVSSDFMDQFCLEPAALSDATTKRLQTIFPPWMPPANPIDLWPAVEQNGAEKTYGTAIEAACQDPGVDALFIHCFAGGFSLTLDMEPLSRKAREMGKPIFCWLIGKASEAKKFQIKTQACGIPVYREVYRAVECLNAVFVHAKQTKKQRQAAEHGDITTDHGKAPSFEEAASLLKGRSGVLDEHDAKAILNVCHIPVTREQVVKTAETACEFAASQVSFPVVMKGLVPGKVHKTEAGLVKLNLSSPDQVSTAFEELHQVAGNGGKVLIQEQVHGDLELIIGMVRDPQFGPCVMVGMGGVMAEVLDDVVFGVAPLTRNDALELLDRLKHQSLLNGFRGAAPVDRNALAHILCTVGELAVACPAIREMDINPLVITKGAPIAVDAVIVV